MDYVIEYQFADHEPIEFVRVTHDSPQEAKDSFLKDDPDAIVIAIYEEVDF